MFAASKIVDNEFSKMGKNMPQYLLHVGWNI
jgi:hypothetical protein